MTVVGSTFPTRDDYPISALNLKVANLRHGDGVKRSDV